MSAPHDFSRLPAHIHYAVGIDGGGTSTRARVLHRSGTLVGEGRAGASGLMQGIAQAWQHITLSIAQATQGNIHESWPAPSPANTALGIGLAGANNADWYRLFVDADPGYARLSVVSDAVTALTGAHRGKPGALVIMGTGSIGLAKLADGGQRTVGGWGFPCGDEGSGSDLGLRAMALTQWAVDGRALHSPLTRDVYATVGNTPEALLAWCGRARQYEYASLAPLVFQHEDHDLQAKDLLLHAVHSLEQMALTLDPHRLLPLVLAGSIAQRLAPRVSPPLAACIVPAQGDALDGGLALCFPR